MRSIKLFWLTFLSLLTMLTSSYGQKLVNEATITYNIATEAGPESQAVAKSFQGATFTIYIKGTQSRSDMVSPLGTESNFYDTKSAKGAILKQYSGQKLMITLNSSNWSQKNKFFHDTKFAIDNDEQTIAGFKCKKATGTSPDGKPVVIYYTSEVMISNKQYDNAFSQLPGLPVKYEIESGKLRFIYTLATISYEPVVASKFDIPKTGYRVLTYEETQQLHNAGK